MYGVGINVGIKETAMVDWNKFMRESLINMMPSQEKRKEKFYNEMNTKIIHTKKFHCDDDHPIVYYTVDENNKGVCEYCYTKFIYEPL